MNFSRREEPFRYQFAEPLQGKFHISKIGGAAKESGFGEMKVLDLSSHGAKISTAYHLQIEGKEIEITLNFTIVTIEFSIPGVLVYRKLRSNNVYSYGVHLQTDDPTRDLLIKELKAYARKLLEKK